MYGCRKSSSQLVEGKLSDESVEKRRETCDHDYCTAACSQEIGRTLALGGGECIGSLCDELEAPLAVNPECEGCDFISIEAVVLSSARENKPSN